MTYYSAYFIDDYYGLQNIKAHNTLKGAITYLRQRLASGFQGEIGLVFSSKPDAEKFSEYAARNRHLPNLVGVMDINDHPLKRHDVSIFGHKQNVPERLYLYYERKERVPQYRWPAYEVAYNGSMKPWKRVGKYV